MNTRERFLATMAFEPLDRPLYWEFGYWAPTLRRWYAEGLPRITGIPDDLGGDAVVIGECGGIDWRNPHCADDVNRALGFDEFTYRIPVNNLYCPPFEEQILEDREDQTIIRDIDGQVVAISKANGSRHFLEHPVKTRADYDRIRDERLQPNLAARLKSDWPKVREKLKRRTFPLEFGGMQGMFNTPRRMMGFERTMTAFYDDPQLIQDIIDDSVNLLMALYDPLLTELGGECAMISEDICYKGGCFVSPQMFRKFMLPAYKKLTGFYRDHGIRTILVDSDGDVTALLPLLIEGGVSGLFPFEVTGDCNITDIRRQFPRFQVLGGLSKKAIAAGRDAIDAELEAKVPLLLRTGGFIPFVDHTVPPDISWEDFCYYRDRIADLAAQAHK